ncbi:MAG TPA: FkbM family methyltransferase [Candidatus Omnitrophota bacterium]|nr:FkbM family methyltransferase [Candidatus Omnitrophota bacterium]
MQKYEIINTTGSGTQSLSNLKQLSRFSSSHKWGRWRAFFSLFKWYQYIDYMIRAKRHMSYTDRGERELKVLKQFVDPQRASIDVGANKGIYTYWLEKFSKRVYAYEPNQMLVQTFLQGVRGNVDVRCIALSNTTGKSKFCIPIAGVKRKSKNRKMPYLEHQGGNMRSQPGAVYLEQEVEAFRLDDLEHEPVGFLKIDVEGHEMEIIQGAKQLIQRDRPVMLVELVQAFHERPLLDVVREVEGLGYRSQVLLSGEFLHPSQVKPEYFVNGHPQFIKNFFFIPC